MKQLCLVLVCSLGYSMAFAQTIVLSMGETFKCSPSPSMVVLRTEVVPRIITCQVLGDVYSPDSKKLAVPNGSKLVGNLSSNGVAWKRLIHPNGLIVQNDKGDLPFITSRIVENNEVLIITVQNDWIVNKSD